MVKNEKMRGCVALCNFALNNLKELKEETEKELNVLFLALGIKDNDSEKVEDPTLYGIALNLEDNARDFKNIIEDLESIIKDLERVKL